MRRHFGIIITLLLVISVLIALSAAGSIELDRPFESEQQPIRSSYSTGPTGTRAFYQLLEESGRPVGRWRKSYLAIEEIATQDLLIAIGPFQFNYSLINQEARALQKWVAAGGSALIISRFPAAQFGDPFVHSDLIAKNPDWQASPEQLVDPQSDRYIVQPTELTNNLSGLALSTLAARMTFKPPAVSQATAPTEPEAEKNGAIPETSPSPAAVGSAEDEPVEPLYAPVIHLSDKDGSMLADFKYGKGRVVFLSDPFVIANNGISRGSNLALALNLINALSGSEKGEVKDRRRIHFDEYHHGYRSENNPLINYFRGTPMPWLFAQGLLLSLLMLYTYGRRFARPLPLPESDRHSPLEFVGSMANLQQAAKAGDLALENIYPRFRAQLCRRLGLSSRATVAEITARLHRLNLPLSESQLREVINKSEKVLNGGEMDDTQLIRIVASIRGMMAQFKS